ncbi:MAG: hypothetical protein HY850_03645 [Betaproteobacteria bacterium]|nr:hypothetical protein [Betaproteobacteria bacterium]
MNHESQIDRALAEPYAFAVLLWPAVVGIYLLAGQDQPAFLRYALIAWLAIMHLAAYGGGRGMGFGNVTLFNSAVVAMACHTYPSLWALAWLPLLLVGLYAAQRVRLNVPLARGDGMAAVP